MTTLWAECLVYRLGSERTFEETCRRAGYALDGMGEGARDVGEAR